jgi:hypothetical protein
LLVGAILLMQSLRKIRTTSPGFSTTRVFDTSIPLTAAGYDAPRAKTFQDELIPACPRAARCGSGRLRPRCSTRL